MSPVYVYLRGCSSEAVMEEDWDIQPSVRERKAGALIQATQMAVICGSIGMGLIGLCLALVHGAGFQSLQAAGIFFIYSLIISLVVVNGFVWLVVLPAYLLCGYSPGRVQAAIAGALGGLAAIVFLSLLVAGLSGWDYNFLDLANRESWSHGQLAGFVWYYWLAGPLYGFLVGLFTSELQSGRSQVG